MMRHLILLACAAGLTACATAPQPPAAAPAPNPAPVARAPLQGEIVSYIRTWPLGSTPKDMDAGTRWTADQVKGDDLTRLNIAFGLIRNGTEVYIKDLEPQPTSDKTGTIAPFATMWDEVAKLQQKYPKLKINLSVGGWGADGFSDMAMKPETRAQFIANLLAYVEKYKLSGVDIDWEYPVGPDWGVPIKVHSKDRENYPALLEETKAALNKLAEKTGQKYELSVAVPASPWFGQKNDMLRVAKTVDFMKVMAYDFYGSWSKTTGHNANLYQRTDDPAWGGWSADQGMQVYLNYGIDPKKLLLGVAFYGRAWSGVENKNNGLFQPFKAGAYDDGLSWTDLKSNFINKNGYTRYWDEIAKVPYLYNGDIFISYEDPEALKFKVDYMKEKKLGGIMIWEYAHDPSGDLLGALNTYMRQ